MNLQQLQTFVQVVQCGSFSRAAIVLDTAQPALSRQVRALEVELGQTLLIRTGRGVTPTEAGRRLLEHSYAILQHLEQAREDLGQQRDEPVGHIIVGLPPSLARRLCLPLIKAFSAQMPKAHLAIVEGFSTNIAEWLSTGRMDMGLVYTPEPHPHIEVHPLQHEQLCLIGPEAQLAHRHHIAFHELPDFDLIMPQRGHVFRKLMEAQATLLQVKLHIAWEVSSVPAVLDLVRAGCGYATLTGSALYGHIHHCCCDTTGLISVPIENPQVPCTLCLVQSATKQLTPLVRKTGDVLRQLCSAIVATPSGSA